MLTVFAFPFVFFNDTATTEIYTLSLHDALPISFLRGDPVQVAVDSLHRQRAAQKGDRKSTRLNSSHVEISYAVCCLKKKKRCPSSCRCERGMAHLPNFRRRSPRQRQACHHPDRWSASRRASWRFFFNDTATTEIYTLSLHDALPI